MAVVRIKKEIEDLKRMLQNDRDFLITYHEIGNYQIQVCIRGPNESLYKQYLYFLNFQFPNDYPYVPPQVTFMNKIYHPNVNILGYMYLGILKNDWNPDCNIEKILQEIKKMLIEPQVEYPFCPEALTLYLKSKDKDRKEKDEYKLKVEDWASKYAIYYN